MYVQLGYRWIDNSYGSRSVNVVVAQSDPDASATALYTSQARSSHFESAEAAGIHLCRNACYSPSIGIGQS